MADQQRQLGQTLQYIQQHGTACPDTDSTNNMKKTKKKGLRRGCGKLFKSCFFFARKRNDDSDFEISPSADVVSSCVQEKESQYQTSDDHKADSGIRNVITYYQQLAFEYPPIPDFLKGRTVVDDGQFNKSLGGRTCSYRVSREVAPVQEMQQPKHMDGEDEVGCCAGTLPKSCFASEASTSQFNYTYKSSQSLHPFGNAYGGFQLSANESMHTTSTKVIPDVRENMELTQAEHSTNDVSVQTSESSRLCNATDCPLLTDVKSAVKRISSNVRGRMSPENQQNILSHRLQEIMGEMSDQKNKHTGRMYKYIGKLVITNSDFRRSRPAALVYMQNEYCHPRFCEENIRLDTLINCNDRQRKGYRSNELARVGWYFNGRALVTFCCGMEMPQTPRGEPLDVHRGLSPHCSFAVNLRSSIAFAFDGEMQRVEERMQSLELSGASAELSYGVQASDDPYGTHGQASDAFEEAQHDLFVGYQETRPGDHWETGMDYALNFSVPVEDSSYREGLVTNRTPTAAEVWQPYSGVSEEPDGEARPAEFQQNSYTSAGRVFVRAPGSQSSQGAARLLRALESNEPGRRSPPQFNIEEQIEMMGGPLGDGDRPRHPQFAFPSVRIWTYEGWPRDHPQRPPVLADAGLFYAGYGDCVLCYSCGIGLRHWTPMDNAWIEHARWRPACFYVRNIQGEKFVEVAQEMTRNNRHPTYEEVRLEANRRQRAAEQGEDLDAQPVPPPGDRDRELNLLCKVCYTREMCIVLMPCRHLAVCENCSGRAFACPICRSRVESSFRASFG